MNDRFYLLAFLLVSLCFFGHTQADEPAANKAADTLNKGAVKGQAETPLHGRITDETGAPVAGAKLTINGPDSLESKTDEQGRYSFVDIQQAGVYRLRVESHGWIGFTDYQDQLELDLDPDQNIQKDLTLQRACKIKVNVVDENNEPVLATIFSYSVATNRRSNSSQVRTNQQGTATLQGIKRSEAKRAVVARANGFAQASAYVGVKNPAEIGECTIVLKKGKTIRGKAICKDGNPATGWKIFARPTSQKFGPVTNGFEIKEDGSFELADIGDDPHRVYISIPTGEYSYETKTVLDDALLTILKQPIKVTVDHPSPASMGYVTCKVRWIGKPPERGFDINAYCQDLKLHTSHFIKSDAKEVKLGPMPRGIYRFSVRSSTVECMNLRGIKNLDKLDQIKVPNDEPFQIVVRQKSEPHLQGKVFDAETKMPITKFRLRVTKIQTLSGPNYVTGNDWHLTKNDKGEFFYDVPGPGIYNVQIIADGYAMQRSVEVNTDETPDKMLDLALSKGIQVVGRVVDTDGKGVANAKVRAVSLSGGSYGDDKREFLTEMGALQSNEKGEFTFEHLSKGYETIRVDHPGFVYSQMTISIDEEGAKLWGKSLDGKLKITLKMGATIQGTVFTYQGEPAANEPVFFHKDNNYSGIGDQQAGLFAKTTTDENGNFSVTHIPSAFVYVSRDFTPSVKGVVRHAVKTKEGQTHQIDLGGKSKITGRCLVNDQPVAATRIQLCGNDSTFGTMKMYGTTQADGSFTLRGAPPGYWVLYRAITGLRGEWVKVCDVKVPFAGNVELGETNAPAGTFTVNFKTADQSEPPAKLRVDLQKRSQVHAIGRTAARLKVRQETTDRHVFQDVVPGDYDLKVKYGDFEIRKRFILKPGDLNQSVDIEIPTGKATARVKLLDRNDKPSRVTVRLWSTDGVANVRMQTKNDDDGQPYHEVANLADGKYVVRGYFQRNGPSIAELEIVDGKDTTIEKKIPGNLTAPDTTVDFRVFDEQGAFVRSQIDVVSEQEIDVRQGDYTNVTRLIVPKGSTFKANINVPGFEPFEQEIQSIEKPKRFSVILKQKP